ncbi:peptide ABC transporter substrate-binding protein [Furfurilactobacillus milii]|uniref:Peptide ABC transporter substrate-binding protein n=2 Tax=Furfurilactobacillus TaxID=2767882 RepID=A0ABT6D9X6_9LACO|nr:peptide ABC transporter substrate-binding protein [Furfurilactobacillus milii]QLE65463.1 Oligopeptide ABC transporter periplasmic oligopeptide-binding protein OppA [Furfurilactobacillus rossiae]MCF6160962.1 peptide ABC transporter substrate-binding protein [Furfurilactobacillus milii]MCF6163272.1 peptide ABC transporter substrate-binding protein [Furfurilactobacillus milii]MDF9913927.1 peptide ABC transporter substrate-binding protein [Furfurilactobacillus milii]MYV04331.1 peptide ABC trans
MKLHLKRRGRVLTLMTVLLALMALVLTACGKKNTSSDRQTLKLSAQAPLDTIDLSKATGYGQTGNVFESFYRLGKKGSLTPGLAKSAEVSQDGKTYTFHLRPNLKWSNGDALTAKDFVYSWRRTLTPSTKSQYAYLFDGIKNANRVNAGQASVKSLGISAPNKNTVVVQLERPIAYFKLLMAYPLFAPQNQRIVDKYGKKYATSSKHMVYSGPFKMTGWNGTGNHWQFVKNNQYWDKKVVKLHKITYQVIGNNTTGVEIFDQKKLSLTLLSNQQVKNYKDDPRFRQYPYSYMTYLKWNFHDSDATNNKATNNLNIRQAIALSVNRAQLTEKVLGDGSRVPTGFVPGGLATDAKNKKDFASEQKVAHTVAYEPALAKKKFATGLKEIDQKKITLTLLSTDDDGTSPMVAQFLKSQLEKNLPGLTLNIRSIPSKAANQQGQKGDFDIMLSGWGGDFNDPITFLQIPQTNTAYNYGKWSDTKYDDLIDRAQNIDANDSEKRWQDLIQASQYLNQVQSFTPLYQANYAYLQQNNVQGIIHNTAGTQWNYKYTSIK